MYRLKVRLVSCTTQTKIRKVYTTLNEIQSRIPVKTTYKFTWTFLPYETLISHATRYLQ